MHRPPFKGDVGYDLPRYSEIGVFEAAREALEQIRRAWATQAETELVPLADEGERLPIG